MDDFVLDQFEKIIGSIGFLRNFCFEIKNSSGS